MNPRLIFVAAALLNLPAIGCSAQTPAQRKTVTPGASTKIYPTKLWHYTLKEQNGNAILNTNTFQIIFQGTRWLTSARGDIVYSGSLRYSGSLVNDKRTFFTEYADNASQIKFDGHILWVRDGGKTMTIGKDVYPLQGKKKTILIKKNGTSQEMK